MTQDFGHVRAVEARAAGLPGNREFRLLVVGAGEQTASLKLEKEHVQALALTLHQVVADVGRDTQPTVTPPLDVPDAPDHDFTVGRIGIGVNTEDDTVILQLDEMGVEEDYRLRLRLDLGQCAALIAQLDGILAGGRPTCPLCGQPQDAGGHVCIRANGHSQQPIPEEGDGEPDDD